jgi:nitrate/nitrite-specific signal transduction histidine kinase
MSIQVEPKERVIVWTITDNGIGRKKATEIKKQHPGVSHGTKITSDRISWMQNIYQQQLSIVYEDLEEGTRVIIQTPILDS